ncbi:MAG: hypothetical protein M3214_14585, partial [Actinomycetota bacterium]|nr:hypothetical protein [Actinomycetota bacterium]
MSVDVPVTDRDVAADTGTGQEYRRRAAGGRAVAYLVLCFLALFALVPFTWLVLAAFDTRPDIFVAVPEAWTLSNFVNLFADQDGLRLVVNSLVYAGGATLVLIVVTTLGGYAL